jgi:hypothetical protein
MEVAGGGSRHRLTEAARGRSMAAGSRRRAGGAYRAPGALRREVVHGRSVSMEAGR